jgi:hypothetical protein
MVLLREMTVPTKRIINNPEAQIVGEAPAQPRGKTQRDARARERKRSAKRRGRSDEEIAVLEQATTLANSPAPPIPVRPGYVRKLWDRVEGETSKAYEAFCLYRDIGSERNFTMVAEQCGSSVFDWKERFNWLDRAIAYDDWMEERTRRENEQQRLEMAKRQAALGKRMQEKAKLALETVPIETIGDVARLVDVGVKVERLALGETTENVQEKQVQIVWQGAAPKWAPGQQVGPVSTVGNAKELPEAAQMRDEVAANG